MTCSLALDHRVHLPPLCLANKAKTDVAASVGFGVDGCYTERVSGAFPGRWLWHHPTRTEGAGLRSQNHAPAVGLGATLVSSLLQTTP